MSKRLVICALLLLFSAPLLAQTDTPTPTPAPNTLTITQRLAADEQGRFTTLLAALKATGLDVTLDGGTTNTLLAPTDSAFKTLADFLGESNSQLLADTTRLNRILLYHLLPGKVFFRQLAQGQAFATELDNQPIQGKLVNGFLTINDAKVSDVDLIASNGVIQVLDNALIPSDILPMAHLRVADFSTDTPGLDVYVDGELTLFQAFGFPLVTGWMELSAAVHTVAFTSNGGSLDQALIIPASFTFRPNSWTTLAAVGSVKQETLIPILMDDDPSPIPAGKARITILNAVEGGSPLDFTLDGGVVVSRLGYPFTLGDSDNNGYFSFDQTTGTYTIGARRYGQMTRLAPDVSGTKFEAGMRYLIALAGGVDHAALIVSEDQR